MENKLTIEGKYGKIDINLDAYFHGAGEYPISISDIEKELGVDITLVSGEKFRKCAFMSSEIEFYNDKAVNMAQIPEEYTLPRCGELTLKFKFADYDSRRNNTD